MMLRIKEYFNEKRLHGWENSHPLIMRAVAFIVMPAAIVLGVTAAAVILVAPAAMLTGCI